MEFISSFTVTVVCVIVLSFILRAVMPRSTLEKYADFVIGIIVTITLVGSFINADVSDLNDIIIADADSSFSKEDASKVYNEMIAQRFAENLRTQICGFIMERFGCECDADVMLDYDSNGGVSGVSGIYIKIYGACDETAAIREVAEKFEVDKSIVHIGGNNGV